LRWGPAPTNDTERQLADLASNYKFNLMGSVRSVDNLLRGFSISFMMGALVVGALDLILRRERSGLLKRVALVNSIWLTLMTAVSLRYFFVAYFVSAGCAADLRCGLDKASASNERSG
jgi:hypothetical protein